MSLQKYCDLGQLIAKILFRETFGDYKPAYGLNGFIVTVDECNYVQRNGLNNFLPDFFD